MSNFNDIFKEAVSGYEAPFDPTMWDKVSSQLSPMEDAFRESVKDYEAPQNPKAWSAIKNQIGSSSSLIQWITGSAAAVGLIFGAIAFIPNGESDSVEEVTRFNPEKNAALVLSENKSTEEKLNLIQTESNTNTIDTDDNTLVNNNGVNSQDLLVSGNPTDQIIENGTPTDNGSQPDVHNVNVTDPTDKGVDSKDEVENSEESDIVYSADFSCSTFEVCAGETLLFNPKYANQDLVYAWDFGDGQRSSQQAVSHVYKQSGNFEVTLSLKDEKTNQILASTKQYVIVNGVPNADFSDEMSHEVIPTIDFVGAEESESMIWKVNGKVISDKNQFEFTFRQKGDYNITLAATNEAGCENAKEKVISIADDYNLFAPTAFTPNGDNRNETFMPAALTMMECEFTMTVYNQASKMVYQTVNSNSPWDGSDITDNSISPNGAYIWVVRLKNGNGTIENYNGQVFITR